MEESITKNLRYYSSRGRIDAERLATLRAWAKDLGEPANRGYAPVFVEAVAALENERDALEKAEAIITWLNSDEADEYRLNLAFEWQFAIPHPNGSPPYEDFIGWRNVMLRNIAEKRINGEEVPFSFPKKVKE